MGGVALAKLPPPTPEQEQAAAAKKETEKAQLEKEKQALDKAQDRVADYYKRTKGGSGGVSAGGSGAGGTAQRTEDTNVSAKAVRAPRSEGPVGGRAQSAEAHSTPAK
jgi:hypothetical protein